MAIIPLTAILSVKVRYLWLKSPTGSFYFKRRIPEDIQPYLGGKTFIQECLHTRDPKEAARKIARLVQKTNTAWAHLRSPTRPSSIEQAEQLPQEFEVGPTTPKPHVEALDPFLSQLSVKTRDDLHHVQTQGISVGAQDIDKHLSSTTAVAQGGMEFLASDCLDMYLRMRAHTPRARKTATFPFNYLIEHLGDRDIRKYRRADANEFVKHLLTGGHGKKPIATTTVQRYLNTLKAAWGLATKENELDLKNPWASLEIPKLGKDAQKRESFTVPAYRALMAAIDATGLDDLRCMIVLVAETGTRLGEIVGLAVSDCHLHAAVPYIDLKPHSGRSLKTDQSARKVPLTAKAHEAVKIAARLRGSSQYLFPRYTNDQECKSDSASATLLKWVRCRLKAAGIDATGLDIHSMRHGMRDLLREVHAPDSVADQLQGWKAQGMGARYGSGYSLERLREWLDKAVSLYS